MTAGKALAIALAVAFAAATSACAQPAPAPDEAPVAEVEARWNAAKSGGVDYQLGGAYAPPPGVTVVVRDRMVAPAPGLFNICYVNGFQTQPGETESWLAEHPELILTDRRGRPVIDANWPDERLLDTRTPEKREAIAAVIRPWLDGCAEAGFDAVEFDNLDSWTRGPGLTPEGNLALATLLIQHAHSRGLWVGQKNARELGQAGLDAGFDFVISEECAVWRECAGYAALYGDRHIDVEYIDDMTRAAFDAHCRAGDLPALVVLRDRGLSAPGDPDYLRAECPAPRQPLRGNTE